jgi:hypothetical protein
MLAGPLGLSGVILYFDELAGRSLALGAALGGILSFVDVAAHHASEFLFHDSFFLLI